MPDGGGHFPYRQNGRICHGLHRLGTWATTPTPANGVMPSSPAIRMFPRISIGGDMIRMVVARCPRYQPEPRRAEPGRGRGLRPNILRIPAKLSR
jgi:hypothetical protein